MPDPTVPDQPRARRRGWLLPIPTDRRPRRFTQLLVGLLLYGLTMAMMVRAVLGLDPWDVFHQGLTGWVGRWIPLSFGAVITVVSVAVLLLWIPLRQRPGVGTVANVAIIGAATDLGLFLFPTTDSWPARIAYLVAGIAGNALAGALYIGAGLGPGARDGLMTGLVARGVGSVRLVRSAIEITVLAVGFLLGGTVGVGTVLYAVSIGPLLHVLLPLCRIAPAASPATAPGPPVDPPPGERPTPADCRTNG